MSAPVGWQDAIEQVHNEAAGLLSVNIVDPYCARALLVASFAGDEAAAILMRGVCMVVASVERAPRKKPVLCLCCPRSVHPRDPFSVCVTMPENGNPSTVIGSAICARCLTDKCTLLARVATALKAIWPNARIVGHVHEAPGGVQ